MGFDISLDFDDPHGIDPITSDQAVVAERERIARWCIAEAKSNRGVNYGSDREEAASADGAADVLEKIARLLRGS